MLNTVILISYFLSAAVSFTTLIIGIYVRNVSRSFYFTYISLFVFIFTLGFIFEISADSTHAAIIATQLQYCGGPFITPFVLLFICDYCGFKLKRYQIGLLFFVPVISFLLVLTYPLNGLFYKSIVFNLTPVPHLSVEGSAFYYFYMSFSTAVPFIATFVLLYYISFDNNVSKKQITAIILTMIVPIMGALYNTFANNDVYYYFNSFFISISCLLLCYSILQLGLYRIAPLAREQIVETMSDGFILMDMQGSFIDANSEAKRLFPQLAATGPGVKVYDVAGLSWLMDINKSKNEFSITVPNGAVKHYRISETEINHANKPICRCLMIYDVTETKQLLDEVSYMAERDALTGLFNRGALYRHGRIHMAKLAENGGSASLLMMDLDNFKSVNDTYGHLKGDEVLKKTAELLLSRFRTTDFVARYGGEEFCAFLLNISEYDAQRITRDLRKCASELRFTQDNPSGMTDSENDGIFHISLSIGLAIYDAKRHTLFETLLADADAALYAAKKAGKNTIYISRTVSSEDFSSQTELECIS